MNLATFEQIIAAALLEVPENIRKHIRNVAFVVEESARGARAHERMIRSRGMLLGLYQGVPLPARSANYNAVLPDKITIFKDSIERLAGRSEDAVRKLVREVVHHEIGHYFGLSDREIRGMGY